MTGGAKIVAGNETSYVRSSADRNSVLIPRGGTVTTARSASASTSPRSASSPSGPSFALLPLLTVEGLYTTKSGDDRLAAARRAFRSPGNSWSLQLPFISLGSVLELGDTTMMRFRIRAVSGDWQVDDFYVDPLRRN